MTDDIKDVVSVSVRIDNVTPAHVTFSVFQAMAYHSQIGKLANYTRGHCGKLTVDRQAANFIISNLLPVAINCQGKSYNTEGDTKSKIGGYVTMFLEDWDKE